MMTLYQGPRVYNQPNASPFCTKVELYLRATGLDYQLRPFNPAKAPKGKMPFIRDGETVVGDSRFIIEYLQRTYGDPLDEGLSAEQHARGRVIVRTLEEATYFCLVQHRWLRDEVWEPYRKVLFTQLPAPLRVVLPAVLRRRVRQMLRFQGTGRHSEAEIDRLAADDLRAVATLLGGGPFIVSEALTTYDCAVFGFLAGILRSPFAWEGKTVLQEFPAVADYCQRIEDAYFQDLR